MDTETLKLPKLPVLGWAAFTGKSSAPIACFMDSPDAEFTSSGHAAIALALKSLGIGPGSKVLVPTYHCPTMIAPVVACGAEPVFYAIDQNGSPQLQAVASAAQECQAMLVAHFYGVPQVLAGIRACCDRNDMALIEDCAHALFGSDGEGVIGSTGDYAIASLTKFLPTNDGGAIRFPQGGRRPPLKERPLRDSVKVAANAIEIGSQFSRLEGLNGTLRGAFALMDTLRGKRLSTPFDSTSSMHGAGARRDWLSEYAPDCVTWKQETFWARWTTRHVKRDRIVSNRRRNYALLRDSLADLPGAHPLWPDLPEHCAPYVFPLWVDAPDSTYKRVRAKGIPVFRWDEIWPSTPALDGDVGLQWATHVFQLGCHQDLEPEDISSMTRELHAIFGGSAGS